MYIHLKKHSRIYDVDELKASSQACEKGSLK